jgi:hypothetical protein
MVDHNTAIILAHRSRIGKRRVHFITTLSSDGDPAGEAGPDGVPAASVVLASLWGRHPGRAARGGAHQGIRLVGAGDRVAVHGGISPLEADRQSIIADLFGLPLSVGPSSTRSKQLCRPWLDPWRKRGAMFNSNQRHTWMNPGGVGDSNVRGCGPRSWLGSRPLWCGCHVGARSLRNSWGSAFGAGWSPIAGARMPGIPVGDGSSIGPICCGTSKR